MTTIVEKKRCCGCYSCYNACPVGAIRMEDDEEGFAYPEIDAEMCIDCGRCQDVCPAREQPPVNGWDEAYACHAKDPEDQISSSSGGVFTLLARKVLAEEGLVCGAAFDEDLMVRHLMADDLCGLERIKGTKYVQSTMGRCLEQTKIALQQGRKVLFSGTPCQVAGLKKYLGADDKKLLTVDLICHGVPSPGVWRDYLDQLGNGDRITSVNFRKKDGSTTATRFAYQRESGQIVEEPQKDNPYMKGFLQNLFVRPACFACRFKGTKRCSDITLGDFWSAGEFHPDIAGPNGVSAVLVHSQKGEEALKAIMPSMTWTTAKTEEVRLWNTCLEESVKETEKREQFYAAWKREALPSLLKTLTGQAAADQEEAVEQTMISRVKEKIRGILHRH